MTEDGLSIPKTLPYTGPVLQTGPWFDSSKTIIERAVALKGLPLARGRVGVFQSFIYELSRHETNTTTTVADLFEAAFNDRTGAVFWRARLSLMTNQGEFIAMLLPHLTAENNNHNLNKLLLDELMRSDLPASGLLRDGRFDPLPVVRWIEGREGYRDMLPASLIAFLTDIPSTSPLTLPVTPANHLTMPTSGLAGRPTSSHLVSLKLAERGRVGATLPTCKAEAEWLSAWVSQEHPSAPQAKSKALQNSISRQYREIRKSIPK